jgi:hypothetical protein
MGKAFAFAPSSAAIELSQTAFFTNPEPVAIVSTPATLPRISKSMDYGSRPLGGGQTRLTSGLTSAISGGAQSARRLLSETSGNRLQFLQAA